MAATEEVTQLTNMEDRTRRPTANPTAALASRPACNRRKRNSTLTKGRQKADTVRRAGDHCGSEENGEIFCFSFASSLRPINFLLQYERERCAALEKQTKLHRQPARKPKLAFCTLELTGCIFCFLSRALARFRNNRAERTLRSQW